KWYSIQVYIPNGMECDRKRMWDGKHKFNALKKEVGVMKCKPHYALFSCPSTMRRYIEDAHDTSGIRKIAVKKPTQCVTQLQIKEHDKQCTIISLVERFFVRLKQAFSVFFGIYRYDHQNFDIDFDNAVLLTNELMCKTGLTEDDQKYQKKIVR
ncbi:hypothetical protein A3Q56_05550, partial [Intoshia linei]